jgi:hypothetical protein
VDGFAGCKTIADRILRTRRLRVERESTEAVYDTLTKPGIKMEILVQRGVE